MINLKKLQDKIWHLHFESSYDLNMHFFRFQENYESPHVSGKSCLKFVDLIEWYSNHNNGVFTYPTDWAGYNIPGKEILNLDRAGISDKNRYDEVMIGFAKFISSKEKGDEDFYIIGTSSEDEDLENTFQHEVAHGLFFSDKEYKEKTTQMVNELPTRSRNFLFKKLKECGYADHVLIDESQAYLATGLYHTFDTKGLRKHTEGFEKLFKKHSKGIKM